MNGRFTIDLNETSGRTSVVEVTLRLDVLDLGYAGRCVAVIVRDALRAWLDGYAGPRLSVDDVTWIGLETGAVMLRITRAGTWTLTAADVAYLRAAL